MNHTPTTALPSASVRRNYRPTLDPANPPPRVDRKAAAALLFARLGIVVSPRTLEGWPLATKLLNGRATFDTAELLAHGHTMLAGSPSVRGGRTRKAA